MDKNQKTPNAKHKIDTANSSVKESSMQNKSSKKMSDEKEGKLEKAIQATLIKPQAGGNIGKGK